MATILIVVDEKGDLLRLERQEQAGGTFFRPPSAEPGKLGTTLQRIGEATPLLLQFDALNSAINDSPRLNDEQRAAARAVFNAIVPGDALTYFREVSPIMPPVADVGVIPKPPYPIFVDP